MTAAAAASRDGGGRDVDRRGFGVALVLLLVAALLSWLAAGSVWVDVPGVDPAADPTGAQLARSTSLAGLVQVAAPMSLAAVAGLVATRGWGRRIVGGLVALAGGALLVGALGVALRPGPAAADWPPAGASSAASAAAPTATAWPWVGALAGGLLIAVGTAAVVRAEQWPVLSGRYERSGGDTANGSLDGPMRGAWDAQDRGEDPTSG